jgi:dipeptidyl aminopeptidase/acylaminoacyl peptidase
MGGKPDEVPERYVKSSPITYLERVRAPALIVQGRNDSRCPAAPVERYRATAAELGKDVDIVWFDGGHGVWADTESTIAHFEAMARFAYRVLHAKSE